MRRWVNLRTWIDDDLNVGNAGALRIVNTVEYDLTCRECGGGGVCQHGRTWKECGGGSFVNR